jgi:hypothetical protein
LLGLVRELIANGVPVGVRDYLDGLDALRLELDEHALAACSRARLSELAQRLWARSDEERHLITRWFEAIPPVASAAVDALNTCVATPSPGAPAALADNESSASSEASAVHDGHVTPPTEGEKDKGPKARISFGGSGETGGILVPRLLAEPVLLEDYVLQPKAVISSRDLSVLWRRYRRTTRRGQGRGIDIQATVKARCRDGQLRQPVYRAQRANVARLVVLADVSPSMAPWLPFLETLADSLALGRLKQPALYYFNNLPRKQLFKSAELRDAEARDAALRPNAGASLLVVSDAGAARGVLNRRRVAQTREFLAEVRELFPTIVWLNPMPEERWPQTTAALIARGPARMMPLSTPHLSLAIDVLRGNK